MPVLDVERLIDNRVEAIRDFHAQVGIPKAELDLSGGIDSAVMACLLKLALPVENIILVHSRCSTNLQQTRQASKIALTLGIPLLTIDLDNVFEALIESFRQAVVWTHGELFGDPEWEEWKIVKARCEQDRTIMGSIRSTLRATVGRGMNRLMGGGIRHGTGNECEDRFLRFYQKGGDGEVDTNPLAMLSKTEVYQLAFGLGKRLGDEVGKALQPIIDAEPTPDLWGAIQQTDEAELLSWTGARFTYGRIDSDTGEIKSIGTIERVARFLDANPDIEYSLFRKSENIKRVMCYLDCLWDTIRMLDSLTDEKIEALLVGAQKAEKATRHKHNPNIPTLGVRLDLVNQGILTNDLSLERKII